MAFQPRVIPGIVGARWRGQIPAVEGLARLRAPMPDNRDCTERRDDSAHATQVLWCSLPRRRYSSCCTAAITARVEERVPTVIRTPPSG